MTPRISDGPPIIPDGVLERWQGIVDIMSELINVPYAIIAKIDPPQYEILRSNATNPRKLKVGDGCTLTDVYCEFVFRNRTKLLIPNALKDETWHNHPEVGSGLISYLGFPIVLPNGEVFGTICILDIKENYYGNKAETLMSLFKDQIETHLALLIHQADLENMVNQRTHELSRTKAQLLFEIDERKKAYSMLKDSEDRFRSLVENSPVGIAISRGEKIIYQNPEHHRIIGTVPFGIGFPFIENIHTEDIERIKQSTGQFLEWKTHILNMTFRFYPFGVEKKSRYPKWVQCRAIHINYEKQDTVLSTLVDITRGRELEHLVRIEDKMSALGRVATAIAHEILSPLSAIKMNLSTLRDVCLADEKTDHEQIRRINQLSAKIQEASNRIDAISRNLNDFARPSAPQFMPADLNHCIKKTLDLCAAALHENKINLKCDLSLNLPSCVVDPQMMEEVLLNLINNSVQALQKVEGSPKLLISSESRQDSVLIHVADSGPGIPEEIGEKVFDPFFTTKTNGMGIGLALVQRMVADHGGILSLHCSKWGGAEFTITIPVEKGVPVTNSRY